MGFVIASDESGQGYSTWGKLRTPLIGAYDEFETYAGAGLASHNYEIFSGFHPDEGLFVRTWRWPSVFFWLDSNSNPHYEHDGPIVGFSDNGGFPSSDSFFSIGAYDWSGNDASNPSYTSVNNGLDEKDIANGFIGLAVTFTTGTLTISADALEQNPPTYPWYGQNIGSDRISAVTDIDTFTAF
jgi:hypothetical protein